LSDGGIDSFADRALPTVSEKPKQLEHDIQVEMRVGDQRHPALK
jgi:hypothetical protein